MKTKLIILPLWFFIAALFSCTEVNSDLIETNDEDSINLQIDNSLFIGHNEALTTDDARCVALRSNGYNSRATNGEVVSVVPITDNNGKTIIYAVNFEQGYKLISATKSFYPVLAEVENGKYCEKTDTGLDIFMNDLREMINLGLNDEDKLSCKAQWRYFEKPVEKLDIEHVSRSNADFYDELDEFSYYWRCQGYNVYNMRQCKEIFSESEYEKILQYATNEDPWEGTQYSADKTAMVIEKVYNPRIYGHVDQLLQTEWNQGDPFNGADPNKRNLGCVTIAVGQIMRYFEYPKYIDWTNMHYKWYDVTDELTTFLYKLRQELGVSNDGGTSINEAKQVFNQYGYYCTKYSAHHPQTITASLNEKKPVYSRGKNSQGKGHAWVVDGYDSKIWENEYRLYVLHGMYYPEFGYDENKRWSVIYDSKSMYHINWGWGGEHNGWFFDNDLYDPSKGYYAGFTSDRQDLIIDGLK